jgi:hypothetical protein
MALHSCANCRWFVSTSRKVRCLKPGAPTILDASSGNRCNAFEFSDVDAAVAARAASAGNSLDAPTPKQSWERLFGA